MPGSNIETVTPSSPQQWREWLELHHDTRQSVWLVYYKQASNIPTITWSESVDEALCFGWIDGRVKPIDNETYMRLFSRRRARSIWSKVNKEKVDLLIANGRMTKAGLKCIELAKQNGSWTVLDEAETLAVPADLQQAFDDNPGAADFFGGLSKSARKSMLQWMTMAKRPETRQKRAEEIARLAAQGQKPKQF